MMKPNLNHLSRRIILSIMVFLTIFSFSGMFLKNPIIVSALPEQQLSDINYDWDQITEPASYDSDDYLTYTALINDSLIVIAQSGLSTFFVFKKPKYFIENFSILMS